MSQTKRTLATSISGITQYDGLTDKINLQVLKRVQEIRKIVHRQSLKSENLNPLIQAKLSEILP